MIILLISAGTACSLTLAILILHKIIMKRHEKYKKQHQKDQQVIKSFGILYRKSLQDNVIDKNEFESLWKFFTKTLDETKIETFL